MKPDKPASSIIDGNSPTVRVEAGTSPPAGSDATLPPPPSTVSSAPPSAAPSTVAADSAATLPPPSAPPPGLAGEGPGLRGSLPLTKTGASDVTLDPSGKSPPDMRSPVLPPASLGAARGAAAGTADTAGTAFGDYQLLEPIAKGGMGIVYKARQRKLNRIVALKMILAGQFADQSDIDRFYAEAESAAALSHPNIVAIYEVGEVEGQHFFSMDFIQGKSLAALVRENPLKPQRAAELVKTLAEAMQYAHDRGIVHRDLKPANVLLDARERPMITDFGLAKQVSGGQSQLTMAGAVVGTPSYMPPEQAAGKGDEVGPLSDLYSLGAVLYELVTGRPPFRAASPFETIRQVLETEPLGPRLVNPSVPADLETICLKCLQKEKARRYASMQELAEELGRFLNHKPIQARPITSAERFWRLCKRNPVTSSAIALAAVALVAASLVSTVAYFRTSAALVRESAARNASDESFRDAMGAVNDLFTTVSEDTLLNQPGMQPLRQDLLKKALVYYDRFLTQRANDPRVQDELAAAYFRVGLITEVLESPDEALPHYEAARTMQARQLAQQPKSAARLEALGNTLNAIGTVWVKKKDYAAARREYGEAVKVRRQLAALAADNVEYQRVLANTVMNIGLAEYNAGNLAAARQQFAEAQKLREVALKNSPTDVKLRRDLGKGYYNLGNIEWDQQRGPEAERHFAAAAEAFEKLTADEPGNFEFQKLLAICYRFLGEVLSETSPAEARSRYEQALDRLGHLAEQNPDVVEYRTEQAGIWMYMWLLESQAGNAASARDALIKAQQILAPLVERFPSVPRYQRDLAVTLRELAVEQSAAGDAASAADNLAESLRLLAQLAAEFPDDEEYASLLLETQEITLGAPP